LKRDIIVVGASAGGVDALERLIAELPAKMEATVFVVLHITPTSPGLLHNILSRKTRVPVSQARDSESIEPGRVYVAPPDFHMMLEDHKIRLWRGPKENFNRPSINVLFRSAAVAFGERVAGVVLSGMLDDGSAGLWWVKQHGGTALVQDPETAAFPEMPRNAMLYVKPDFVLEPAALGERLAKLSNSTGRS
jgi:two-component system, chemotaxis family, protein-glutamate methylesterase/glutaminase